MYGYKLPQFETGLNIGHFESHKKRQFLKTVVIFVFRKVLSKWSLLSWQLGFQLTWTIVQLQSKTSINDTVVLSFGVKDSRWVLLRKTWKLESFELFFVLFSLIYWK